MSEKIGEVSSGCPSADAHARAARSWLIIMSVAAGVAHLPTFLTLALAYTGGDSYYAHWFLIPPVSAFFIWLKKDTLRRVPLRGSRWGLVLLAGSLAMHVFAVWFRIDFVSAFSFAVTMWGLALYLFGQRVVREISFALFFLVFMVPLPQLVIGPLAFHIKILSGKLAVWFYTLFGGTAILRGSSIVFSNGKPVWMGYECSGLRSLVTLAALGAAFAHLAEVSRPRKVVLFLLSLPFSVLSNTARVTLLCFAANRWGAGSKSFRVVHDVSSPLVFILVLVGLFGVYKLLSSGKPAKREALSEAAPSDIPRPAKPSFAGIPLVRDFGRAGVSGAAPLIHYGLDVGVEACETARAYWRMAEDKQRIIGNVLSKMA
jgi:exosortase